MNDIFVLFLLVEEIAEFGVYICVEAKAKDSSRRIGKKECTRRVFNFLECSRGHSCEKRGT